MIITVLISLTGHIVIAGIYNDLLPPPLCIPFALSWSWLPGGVTKIFISEGSGPLVFLPALACCNIQ